MIIIEGCRNTGKTYLLSKYLITNPNKFYVYKFPYFPYYEQLNLSKELNAGTYFSFGKDLDLLSLAYQNLLPKNMILDRGFISSIIFAAIFRGEKPEVLSQYIDLIKKEFNEVEMDIVYVQPEKKMRTLLGLDKREKDNQELPSLELLNKSEITTENNYEFQYGWVFEQLSNQHNIRIHKFTNTFDNFAIEQFNHLINNFYKN